MRRGRKQHQDQEREEVLHPVPVAADAERHSATERVSAADSSPASDQEHARTYLAELRDTKENRQHTVTTKNQSSVQDRCQEASPVESLRQRVEAAAADLSASETAVCEQEAIITQLQRSYSQQRCDLRAQLGLRPDEDDNDDVRHAKRIQDLQRQILDVEVTMQSTAPHLERYDADVATAKQARDALAAEHLDTIKAIKMTELRHNELQTELANTRSRCTQQEGQLRAQQTMLAKMEAEALRAQELREAAKAEAAAKKTASCNQTNAAESLLELLRSRLDAVGETLHAREREAAALTRTVARERAERALLTAAIDGCHG